MEFELLSKWGGLLGLIISVITGVWTLISKSTKPFDDRLDAQDIKIEKHNDDLKLHDRRIQKTEDELRHLPNKNEVHEIKLAITRLEGVVDKLETSASATQRTVQRIDDYLREEPK